MILPDVNILVFAFRPDTTDHSLHKRWLKSVIDGDAPYGMSPQALGSFVRIVTNRRIFARPDPVDHALAYAGLLLDRPHCQVISPGPRHWGIFRDLCLKAQATGNLVPDAWFAALAMEHGCEWITTDRGYARFPGLRWRTPF